MDKISTNNRLLITWITLALAVIASISLVVAVACVNTSSNCELKLLLVEPRKLFSYEELPSFYDNRTTVKFDGYLRFINVSNLDEVHFLPLKTQSVTSEYKKSFTVNTDCASFTLFRDNYDYVDEIKMSFPKVSGIDYSECKFTGSDLFPYSKHRANPKSVGQSMVADDKRYTCQVFDTENGMHKASVTLVLREFGFVTDRP